MRPCAKCGETISPKDYALVQKDHDIPISKLPNLAKWKKSMKLKSKKMRTSRKIIKKSATVHTEKDKLYLQTEPNRAVFYFAAEPRDFLMPISGYPAAYGKYKNSGHTVSDSRGYAAFSVKCPRVYERDKKTYPRHIHYMISDKSWTKWLPKIYTTALICDINKSAVKRYKKNKRVLVIDALPKEYYNKNHIPGAINIYHESAKRMSNAKLTSIIKKHCRCPDKYKNIRDLKKMPIIVYCYSSECTAARDLIKRLYKVGFHNVLHYAGGIKDWLKK